MTLTMKATQYLSLPNRHERVSILLAIRSLQIALSNHGKGMALTDEHRALVAALHDVQVLLSPEGN